MLPEDPSKALAGFVGLSIAVIVLALIPGRIAKYRGHPNAQAIMVCSFVGMLFFGVGWFVALVWAFTGESKSREKAAPKMFPSEPWALSDPLARMNLNQKMNDDEIEEIMLNAGIRRNPPD